MLGEVMRGDETAHAVGVDLFRATQESLERWLESTSPALCEPPSGAAVARMLRAMLVGLFFEHVAGVLDRRRPTRPRPSAARAKEWRRSSAQVRRVALSGAVAALCQVSRPCLTPDLHPAVRPRAPSAPSPGPTTRRCGTRRSRPWTPSSAGTLQDERVRALVERVFDGRVCRSSGRSWSRPGVTRPGDISGVDDLVADPLDRQAGPARLRGRRAARGAPTGSPTRARRCGSAPLPAPPGSRPSPCGPARTSGSSTSRGARNWWRMGYRPGMIVTHAHPAYLYGGGHDAPGHLRVLRAAQPCGCRHPTPTSWPSRPCASGPG